MSLFRQTIRSQRALGRSCPTTAVRSLTSTSLRCNEDGSRTSPGQTPVQGGQRPHPGYTSYDTPATSAHPKDMPGAPDGAKPTGTTPNASTKQSAPHPEVHTMAEGAKQTGEDAVTPVEKQTKVWGPNARAPEFNEHAAKRRNTNETPSE